MLFQNHICSISVVHVWSPGHLAFFLHYIHPHCHMLRILILQKTPSKIAPIHWSNRAADVIGCWVVCPFATTRNWTSGVGGKGPSQWILSLPVPSPRPHCFHMEPRWRREAEPLSCSQPAASLVKSRVRMGPSLWTTVLPEWLGLIAPKSGFQTSPRVLWILPCLRDHAKSADLTYSLPNFLFYVTFIYEAQSTSKELMLTTPHSSIRCFCWQDSFFFSFFRFFHSS